MRPLLCAQRNAFHLCNVGCVYTYMCLVYEIKKGSDTARCKFESELRDEAKEKGRNMGYPIAGGMDKVVESIVDTPFEARSRAI